MARIESVPIAIAAIVALSLSPAAASGKQCKSGVLGGDGFTDSQATSSWVNNVKSHYGSAWANLSIAKNKQSSEQNVGFGTFFYISAIPCRRT